MKPEKDLMRASIEALLGKDADHEDVRLSITAGIRTYSY